MFRKVIVAVALVCVGCVDSNVVDGRDAIVDVVDEPQSSACPFGGVKIDSGLDENSNGELEPTEVSDTRYVCNGADAKPPSRTIVADEPAGDNCSGGGVKVQNGLDNDRDGELSEAEVEETRYVCNGTDGADGEDGADGTNGANGTNGADGMDGVTYLTSVTGEPANGACGLEQGVRIDNGPDTNRNGTLDTSEVEATEYVCDGADGASSGTEVVTQYDGPRVVSNGNTVTLVSATLSVPGPGTIVAMGATDAFCSTAGGTDHDCDSSGQTPGHVRVVDTSTGGVTTGDGRSYFWLADDTTEAVHRSNVFTVGSAGTYTYYLRGVADFGEIGFWRNQLTLVYLAD